MSDHDPLNPPWWHVRFWFWFWVESRRMDRASSETCTWGCCVRWVDGRGREIGGVNEVGVDHWGDQ